jgi:hypothetical protein
MTMYDSRTSLSQSVVDEVRGHFPDLFLHTVIPRTIRLGEAPSYGQSILRYDPGGRGAAAYRSLAEEIEARLNAASGAAAAGATDAAVAGDGEARARPSGNGDHAAPDAARPPAERP